MAEENGKAQASTPTLSSATQPAADSSFLATVSAVFGAFIGIRRRRDYERDAASFKPAHLIIAGIIGGVIFVVSVALVASFAVSQIGH